MKYMMSQEQKNVKNKTQIQQDLSFTSPQEYQNQDIQQLEVNSIKENKGLLQHKEYQNWLRKRYRVRANINYLWHAHQLYDKQQLDELFQTVAQNQPEIYKYDMKLDEKNGQPSEINIEAFYHVMKKLGRDNFMDRYSFNNIIRMIDRDGNRRLNKNEFYTMLMSRTINQFFQDLNLQSWKKSHEHNPKEDNKVKRHRFASADSQKKFNKKHDEIKNKPYKHTYLPSIITPQNIHVKGFNDKSYQSATNTPIQELDSNISSPNMKANQNMNLQQESKEIENFSQIDITKMIGKLKYENDRTQLMKNFLDVRRDKSVDIEDKCDKLNQILNQKYFNVDNIGVSPTQKLLSKNKIQQIRQKTYSPSQITQFVNNSSIIDQSEVSVFLSEVNGFDSNGSVYQSASILPSINQNNDKNNQLSIDNSTNLSPSQIDSSNHDINSIKILSPSSLRKKFQLIQKISEVNIEKQTNDKIKDPLDKIDEKYYNINHHSQKKQNPYLVRRNYFKKDQLQFVSPADNEIHQNYEVLDAIERKNNIFQSSTLDISQPDIIFDDSENDDEGELTNKRVLEMIVERAKYKGKRQAEILSTECNLDKTQAMRQKIEQQNLRQISQTTNVQLEQNLRQISKTTNVQMEQNQFCRNMRDIQKQRSLSQQKKSKDNKREDINLKQIQNSREIKQIQRKLYYNNILNNKQDRVQLSNNQYQFVKL